MPLEGPQPAPRGFIWAGVRRRGRKQSQDGGSARCELPLSDSKRRCYAEALPFHRWPPKVEVGYGEWKERELQKNGDFWEALGWIRLGFFLQITFLAKQKGIMNL